MARFFAGKIGYVALCLAATVILVVAGYAHKVVGYTTQFGKGVSIPSSPSAGAMNILVMGLESRTDYQGNELDHHMQVVLHSGSVGGQATNVLILIHIFAGGKKAVGFSIPRDDYVTFPQPYLGYSAGKIDAAYTWAYTQYLDQHVSEAKADRFLHANQAGQQATIDTVESVTGVKVDHFIEVNLAGFYYLAQAFNGVEVCIKPAPQSLEPGHMPAGTNLTDKDPLANSDNSGFSAYKNHYNAKKMGAQYIHLTPAQSLAFVRSRDTVPGVDKGRTYRQQAVIDYVIWKLKHDGLYSDVSKMNTLLQTASKYLITDSTFNLLDFAPSMSALKGEGLNFATLPFTTKNGVSISGYSGLQDINLINVPKIQQTVRSAFYPGTPAPSPSGVTVDVYNGNPKAGGLAGQVSQALTGLGYKAGKVANATKQAQSVTLGTQVFYGAGAQANAERIGFEFGTTAASLSSLPAGHVEVLTGSTVTQVPTGIQPSSTAAQGTQSMGAQVVGARAAAETSATSAASSKSSSTSSSGGIPGDSTKVTPSTPFGTPCVY